MLTIESKKEIENKIIKIAKKLNIFTFNDIETLIETSKIDIIKSLEYLTTNKIIRKQDNCYVYIPQIPTKTNKKQNKHKDIATEEPNVTIEASPPKDIFSTTPEEFRTLFYNLELKNREPREIYVKHFKDFGGYDRFFYSPIDARNKILKLLKILKETHGFSQKELEKYARKRSLSTKTIHAARHILPQYGFMYYLTNYPTCEPLEIYQYFKEYYLSPEKLNPYEARDLAILKFEEHIGSPVDWDKFHCPRYYLNKLKKEYSKEEIQKYRTYNFSEFDIDSVPQVGNSTFRDLDSP